MPRTIQQVIDVLAGAVPGEPPASTVDTVKSGDVSQPVTRVAVCFMATSSVLARAAELGASLVITHEPTFYNHLDKTGGWMDDPVFLAKRALLEQHRLVVWRFHDGPHRLKPDGITEGLVHELGWETCVAPGRPDTCVIPPVPLRELAAVMRNRLGLERVSFVGDPELICERVAMRPGAPGGESQMGRLRQGDAQVLITGEINEWETSEYVRDANDMGRPMGLILLGHAGSEEVGMRWLTAWMRARVPGVDFVFIPVGNPFHHV